MKYTLTPNVSIEIVFNINFIKTYQTHLVDKQVLSNLNEDIRGPSNSDLTI